MKSFYLIIICICVFASFASAQKEKRRKWCHFNELLNCGNGVAFWCGNVNTKGMAHDSKDLDLFCHFKMNLFPDCVGRWSKLCGNAMHQELFQFFMTQQVETWNQFCNGPRRDVYLKDSACVGQALVGSHINNYRRCLLHPWAGFEYVRENITNNMGLALKSLCCTYGLRFWSCIDDYMIPLCGIDGRNALNLIFDTWDLYYGKLCFKPHFDATEENCRGISAPIDALPKKGPHDTFVRRLYSMAAPMTGGFGEVFQLKDLGL